MKNLILVFHILLIFSIVGCAEKGVYVGEKKDGNPHGQGTLTFSSGKKYVGEFKDGKQHGQGTYTYPKKEGHKVAAKYEGEWKNGKQDGQATYTWSDGGKYVGKFKDGRKNGQGTWEHPDGRKYVGEYKNNWWDGKGVNIAPDGMQWYTLYDGEFKKGKFHGQGKLVVTKIDPDGTLLGKWNLGKWKGMTVIGEFKNGMFWNVKSYNDKGEQQTFSVNQGEWYGWK